MFSVNRNIDVKVPSPDFPDGWKRATVRFPSDEEWCRRMRKQETVVRDLGRGKTQTEVTNAEAVDAELFDLVRLDKDGAPFDPYEASRVIATIGAAKPAGPPERIGAGYAIALKVPGGQVVHRLKMPTTRQLADYRAAACCPTDHKYNVSHLRLALEPAGVLYDALLQEVEGYDGPVPVVHKALVVSEIRADIDALTTGELDPE